MTVDEAESYIVGASALATAAFSFLIWRANIQSAKAAKGAADAARESAKISKLMLEAQEEQKEDMRDQLKRDILKCCSSISKILREIISVGINPGLMNSLPEKISITNNELANYFTKDERQLIFYTVKMYETFRGNYFKNGKASFMLSEQLTKDYIDLSDRMDKVIIEFTDQIVISSKITIG